jgi:hypothetical protein
MAVRWNLVWGRPQSTCCPPSCYNFTQSCNSSGTGNIFDGFPLTIQTFGEAIAYLADVVKESLSAQDVIVTSSSSSVFDLTIRLGMQKCDVARASLHFSGSGGNFPVRVTYTKGSSSGSASFQSLDQVITYLNQVLS